MVEGTNHNNPSLEKELGSGNAERERYEQTKKRVLVMSSFVADVKIFSSDGDDEFRVLRESGETQGIFKTWAVPVIPFLETGSETELVEILQDDGVNLWEKLDPRLAENFQSWHSNLKENPVKLWQTLERWRSFSETYDGRLYELFEKKGLPEDRTERVAELYLRLRVAFGYAAPFYHLEAMVADSKETRFNPISANREITEEGGFLDVAGMLLPSALRGKVLAEKLDWKGLSWEKISELVSSPDGDEESILATRIARHLGVDAEDVIFAANVLQWIPVSVGGKKTDLDPERARQLIIDKLSQRGEVNNTTVARDMNALIRFLNWFPLTKKEVNFTSGEGWRYAAVCDTANLFLKEIKDGGVFSEEFDEVFRAQLADQVDQLDATSAKGRFLLSLVMEGRLKPEFNEAINQRFESFLHDVSLGLTTIQKREEVVSINENRSRCLVGGKAVGLREAAMIFGKDRIVGGTVITSETIERWLKKDEQLWTLIRNLDLETDIQAKISQGQVIAERISEGKFPADIVAKLAIAEEEVFSARSSSFDEDTIIDGTAAGIYETEAPVLGKNVDKAIPLVISSFFSEKAISYRALHGLSDRPTFAVIISPFIEGRGGAAFSLGYGRGWEIVVGENPNSVVSNNSKKNFDSYKLVYDMLSRNINRGWLEEATIKEVGAMVTRAEKIFGGRVDLEFVVDENEQIRILQLRSLKEKPIATSLRRERIDMVDVSVHSLPDFSSLRIKDGKKVRLLVGPEINLDQFQGDLFRWLIKNRHSIAEIRLSERIPRTNHFANICVNLGIRLSFPHDY